MGRHSADIFEERENNVGLERQSNSNMQEREDTQPASNSHNTVYVQAPGLGSTLAKSIKQKFLSIVDGEEGSIFWGIKELIRLGGIGLHAVNTYLIESQRRLAEQKKGRDSE